MQRVPNARTATGVPRIVALIAAIMAGCGLPSDEASHGSAPIWNGTTDTAGPINDSTVALYHVSSSGTYRWCSGTLITPTVVLTASHCVFDGSLTTSRITTVRVGLDATVPRSSTAPNGYIEYDVASCVRHPSAYINPPPNTAAQCYVMSGTAQVAVTLDPDFDVALLTLTSPVPRDIARPRPVTFAQASTWVGTQATMLGYGRTSSNNTGNPSPTRQSGTTPVVASSQTAGTLFLSNVLVTQASTGGPALRGGDSGGPLLLPGSTSPSLQSALAGVASYGINVGSGGTRSIFTAVAGQSVANWLSALLANPAADPTVVPLAFTNATAWTGEGTDAVDNCPGVLNPSQDDADGDGRGDACDLCPSTGYGGGDQSSYRFGPTQPNCNARVERPDQLNVTPRADACDPYACNPVDELYSPTGRRRDCLASTFLLHDECTVGSYEVKVGMAPRVGVPESGQSIPFTPLDISDPTASNNRVSPTRRCVCLKADGTQQAPEQCYGTADGACPAQYAPPSPSSGRGWYRASLQRSTGVTTPAVGTGQVWGEDPGVQAPILTYRTRTGRESAARAWRDAVGEATWTWNWQFQTMPSNLPTASNFQSIADPAEVVFWTRAQSSSDPLRPTSGNDPQNAAQQAQRMADSYTERGQELINERRVNQLNPFVLAYFNQLLFIPPRPPIGWPPPPPEAHVSRYMTAVYPLTGQSGWSSLYFTNGASGDAVRGLVIGQLDVRQARVTGSVATQGASGQLPTLSNAAYAVATPDAQSWGDLAAFGGRDASSSLKNDLFYTTHTYDANGDVAYTWHKATFDGSPPAAREDAAVSFNAAGTRLYVVGGRAGTTLYGDVRYYDFANQKWYAVSLSTALSARYDAGLAVANDTLFVGGGVGTGTTYLGDLLEIEGTTGQVRDYGNVLPTGGEPQLSFDDHHHGLVFAGGYVGTQWYADLWRVTITGTTASAAFIRNFTSDGMAGTPNYSVVADLYHGMYWAVPGYNPGGTRQELRYLRDETAKEITAGGGGGSAFAARSAGGTVTNPPRQTSRTDSTAAAVTIRPTGGVTSSPRVSASVPR